VSITKLSQHTAHLQRLAADPQGEVCFLLIDPESPETVPETGQYVGRIPRNAGLIVLSLSGFNGGCPSRSII
jgi:hypothetical protein